MGNDLWGFIITLLGLPEDLRRYKKSGPHPKSTALIFILLAMCVIIVYFAIK